MAGGFPRAGLRRLYADLLAARRNWPALRDFTHRTVRLLPDEHSPALLHLVRGLEGELHAYFNLTEQVQALPEGASEGRALLFSSESVRYRGGREAEASLQQLRPYECVVLGPAAWQHYLVYGISTK